MATTVGTEAPNHQQPNVVIELAESGPITRYAGPSEEAARVAYDACTFAVWQKREVAFDGRGSVLVSSERKLG